jgi:2,3,4,5-tetrahydropyridine-2,6-dicarboxylate N-succinyltransferase
MTSLQTRIESLFAAGAAADKAEGRAAFFELQRQLTAGEVRSAEPDAASATGWRVNAWVKQGILLGFRFGDMVDMSTGDWAFYDKDTMPVNRPGLGGGVRIVPGGSMIRAGAYVAPGVICIPPMYINVGAYVGEGTLVDSHALVGSCAQIGARVHISAAAQIGGVIEPVGAMPVIVEDDVLVGGNTGIYEGAVIKRRAVIAAGVVLTGSTPVYDLPNGRIIRPEAGQPLVVPEGAVVVPGARTVTVGAGKDWGLSLATPVIVKYRDDRTDTRTELEAWIR